MIFVPSVLRSINFALASGISTAFVVNKIFYGDKRKEILELKINDKPTPVPQKIHSLINEVLVDMKLDKEDEKKITPFITTSYDVQHIEKTLFGKEIYLGIPQHFLFDTSTLNDFVVEVEGKPLARHSREYEGMKRALTLSNEAKKFAIAHQIYMSQNLEVLPYTILPALITLNCCALSFVYEKTRKNLKKPHSNHFHFITFITGAWLYVLCHDLLCIFDEVVSDHETAELGNSYVKGGIEYYGKMIERNKLLKRLSKNAPYSESGDIVTSSFRTDHMPLYRRLKYLNDISNGNKSSVWHHIIYV